MALPRSIELENNRNVPVVSLFLITDGEDNDVVGIEDVQAKLNANLRARSQNQRSNKVGVRTSVPIKSLYGPGPRRPRRNRPSRSRAVPHRSST